jgi:hypothetical protein
MSLESLSIKILLSLTILLVLSPTTVLAQPCNRDPDYRGSIFSILFKDAEDDCSIFEEGSPQWIEWLSTATVSCIEQPELVGSIVGDPDSITSIINSGGGSAAVGIEANVNFAPGSDELEEYPELDLHRQKISMEGQSDRARFTAECLYEGFTGEGWREECAAAKGMDLRTSNNSVIANNLYSTWEQRTSNPKYTIEKSLPERAEMVLACNSDDQPDDVVCDNYYVANQDGLTSKDISRTILERASTVEDYFELDIVEQQEVMSLKDTKAAGTFYIVVVPIRQSYDSEEGNIFEYLSYLFNFDPDPIVIRGSLAAVHNIANANIEYLRDISLPNTAEQVIAQVRDENYIPIHQVASLVSEGDEPPIDPEEIAGVSNQYHQLILNKINAVNPNCDIVEEPPTQTAGGVSDARTDGNAIISWLQSLLSPQDPNIEPFQAFIAYLVQPVETKEIQAAIRAAQASFFNPSDADTIANTKVGILQPLEGDRARASIHIGNEVTTEEYPCDEGTCVRTITDEVRANFGASRRASITLDGGERTQWMEKEYIFGRIQNPLNSDYLGEEECYWDGVARIEDANIDSIFGVTQGGFVAPNCTQLGEPPSSSLTCDEGELPPLTQAQGACNLCNTFLSDRIPPLMERIFESAGQEYGVPPSLVAGIMFAEGGFEPRTTDCYGEYTDESVEEASVCGGEFQNCQTCNVSSEGALGPIQWIPTWMPTIDGRFSDLLPEWYTGNPCNFSDAVYALTAKISRDFVGSPLWEDTCDGIDLHNEIVNTHTGCGDWTIQDIATAARAHRGLCDPRYQNQIIQVATCSTSYTDPDANQL